MEASRVRPSPVGSEDSVGSVRFQEGKTLHPSLDATGIWRFDSAEVEALAVRLGVAPTPEIPAANMAPGKLAARACRLFREGKSVVDVVIELEQPFEVVQPLYRAFMEGSGGLYVPAPMAERMAIVCEVDKLTAEIVLEELESNSRKLAELSAARHGAQLSASDSRRKVRNKT
jgi:hypothetical protein